MINAQISNGVLHTLAGFEKSLKDGTGARNNFILYNGDRSIQRDNGAKYYTVILP